jgi:hypothetical protein
LITVVDSLPVQTQVMLFLLLCFEKYFVLFYQFLCDDIAQDVGRYFNPIFKQQVVPSVRLIAHLLAIIIVNNILLIKIIIEGQIGPSQEIELEEKSG